MWLPDDGFIWTETCWSSFYNFNYFNNLRIFQYVCISWTIKCLILLMHRATMKFMDISVLHLYRRFTILCRREWFSSHIVLRSLFLFWCYVMKIFAVVPRISNRVGGSTLDCHVPCGFSFIFKSPRALIIWRTCESAQSEPSVLFSFSSIPS